MVDSLDRPLDPGPASVAAASAGLTPEHDVAAPPAAPAAKVRPFLDSDILYSFLRSKVTVLAALVTLAIVLDVGTDNAELLEDPQYLGWRHRRISDDEYYAFIDDFVAAVRDQLPNVLLQWEDFATVHALPILERYRDKLLTFNDDIQGTAAVTLGALHGASKVASRPLSQQQVVMLGAGSAGIGVLGMVRREMMAQGLSGAEANERIWVVDVVGLLTDDRTDLSEGQRAFAQPAREPVAPGGKLRRDADREASPAEVEHAGDQKQVNEALQSIVGHEPEVRELGVQGLGLGNGAGEAVEQEPAGRLGCPLLGTT